MNKKFLPLFILAMLFLSLIPFNNVVGADSTPPSITINFAGNLSDSGGPYWRSPGESTKLVGVWSDGYYTNDSRQQEDWMYINLTVTDGESAVSNVWLQWLNETTWTNYTYAFSEVGAYWEYNTSGNIQTCEGYNYSFNIVANSTGGSNVVWWNKTALDANIVRRYVQLNCTADNSAFNYTAFYFYMAYPNNDASYRRDRLHHDQGNDGTVNDTGYLKGDIPTSNVELLYCGTLLGYWFDESVCVDDFILDNIYVHFWWGTQTNNISDEPTYLGTNFGVFYNKSRAEVTTYQNDDYDTNASNSVSNITYDNGQPSWGNDYYLEAKKWDIVDYQYTDNSIYEFCFKIYHLLPTIISNRSFTSFILFNIPSNATLNASYADTDGDGLSDWTELYVTYTNPFLSDTDNDGANDGVEISSNSDPNNYTNVPPPPTITGEIPANTSTEISATPTCNVTVNDTYGDIMDVTFASNHSNGIDWVNYQTNSTVGNGSYSWVFTGASSYSTKYWWKVYCNDGTANVSEIYYFTTKTAPTSLTVTSYNDTQISLSWTKGNNDTVVVHNNTDYPSDNTDGTEIYNGSAQTYTHTGLTPGIHHYYRAWNWNGTSYSPGYTNTSHWTAPQSPQNVSSETNIVSGVSMNISISWDNGTGFNRTVVARSYTNQPVLPTDGTIIYNGTGNYIVDTGITEPAYYTIFSYNNASGLWSSGVDVSWYVVWINCYAANNGSAIANYSVFFTNPTGTQTYVDNDATNPHLVNISDIPTGDDISLQVSAKGYETSIYYLDIEVTGVFFIDAFLSVENVSSLYLITVVGPQGEYTSSPLEDVKVEFRKYLNTTSEFSSMSVLYTDANGQVEIYLYAGDLYMVTLSKDGYTTRIENYIPNDAIFTHTFRIYPEDIVPPVCDLLDDFLTFTGEMFANKTIKITYADSNESTTNTQIYLYSVYNDTHTLNDTDSRAGENSFSYYVANINTSRTHYAWLYFNNTANFCNSGPIMITIWPELPVNDPFSFDDRVTPIFGPFVINDILIDWSDVICIIIPLIVLVLFGVFNTGIGIIGCGVTFGLMQGIFGLWFTEGFNPLLALLCPVILAIGILYFWSKKGAESL